MPVKRTTKEKWKSFFSKLKYIVGGLCIGWFAAYIYVIEYGGVWAKPGTFYLFLKGYWLVFSPVLIPITIAALTSYFNRRKRSTDG